MIDWPLIWQLMKRNTVWRWTPWATAAFALLGRDFMPWGLLSLSGLFSLTWILPEFRVRCTFYEAALPIPGRDLWLARTICQLAFFWLPAGAGFLASLTPGGDRSPWLVAPVAAWSVFLLGLGRVRIREFSIPKWMWFTGSLTMWGLTLFVLPTWEIRNGLLPVRIVLGVLIAGGMALFLPAWLAIPKTFQSAPVGLRRSLRRAESERSPFLWSPVLRTLLLWDVWAILQLTLMAFIGAPAIGCLAGWMLIPMSQKARRFLAPLPVHACTLFRIIALPAIGAMVVGSALRTVFDQRHPLSARAYAAHTALSLAMLLGSFLAGELLECRGLSRLPLWLRLAPVYLCSLTLPLLTYWGSSVFDRAALNIAASLPQSWAAFAFALLAPLAALYWLAETTFAQMEGTMLLRSQAAAA